MAEICASSAATLPGEDAPLFHHHHHQQPINVAFEAQVPVPNLECFTGNSRFQAAAGSSTAWFPYHDGSSDAFCLNETLSDPRETVGLWRVDGDGDSARAAAKGTMLSGLAPNSFDRGAIGEVSGGRDSGLLGKEVGKSWKDSEGSELEFEVEEEHEAVEELAKPSTSRTSSKRGRAAEVHNLSEKRRRSRINEKMKALQNLIPNSNKTDKASMLDEAIEYLKQLQLQVQMLSMRNGLTLSSIYMPHELQLMQMPSTAISFGAAGSSLPMNMGMEILPMNQDAAATAFCLNPSQVHLRPYQSSTRADEIYRADITPQHQLDIIQSANADGQTMLDGADSLEACLLHRDIPVQTQDVNNQVLFQDHRQEVHLLRRK